MKSKLFLGIFFLTTLQFCSNRKTALQTTQQKDTTEKHTFFPVTDYIKGQLREIDSLPITPLKIISINGKLDSIWMKKEDIRAFAQPFLHPQIDSTNLQNLFSEKSFLDQTVNAVTFSYDPIGKLPDSLLLKRWDVYIDPEKNTIKRIYLVKEMNNNGQQQTIQLTWKSDKWCKITAITEIPGKQTIIKEETMKWDFSE